MVPILEGSKVDWAVGVFSTPMVPKIYGPTDFLPVSQNSVNLVLQKKFLKFDVKIK